MQKNNFYFPLLFVLIVFLAIVFFVDSARVKADGTRPLTVTVKISVCGNDTKEYGEECDGSDLGGAACSGFGFNSGSLSCDIACEYDTSNCSNISNNNNNSSSGGGGGGGGGGSVITTSVNLSGRAYPLSEVTILKDGQKAITTIAGPDAKFNVTLNSLSTGHYTFSVYSEDQEGRRSNSFVFPVYITSGSNTQISGIFITPTIAVDKQEVKKGNNLVIFGQSIPGGDITIAVNSEQEFFFTAKSDSTGAYLYNFDTSVLDTGKHTTKSKVSTGQEISVYSPEVAFAVGDKNIQAPPSGSVKGDLNQDQRINLVDFSILAYWYKRSSPPLTADLNNDGQVNLIDFSILAYYWTG